MALMPVFGISLDVGTVITAGVIMPALAFDLLVLPALGMRLRWRQARARPRADRLSLTGIRRPPPGSSSPAGSFLVSGPASDHAPREVREGLLLLRVPVRGHGPRGRNAFSLRLGPVVRAY